MRKRGRYSFDLEDGFEGAVDVVFLLIIFFLVASSFDKTVREKLSLPNRDPDKAVAVSAQERDRLDITIYRDSRIAINHEEVDVGDPNSIEAYHQVGEAIENWLAIKRPETPRETALEQVDVFITTDRESYAGAALNVIMACLDRGITPQVIFEEARIARR
ncbi:MAG: biopolymer transporter ExbD [Acidobacteriota bacterium]|nr:MAG: biopolymer transporter ExbD [Acidobacteriota bacterium]